MKVTITFDDTNPTIVAALGKDVGTTLSERKGYQAEMHNPEYVPAVGSETIDDTSKEKVAGEMGTMIYPQIANPDYVAAVGKPTIPNTQTRASFVGGKTLKEAILPYLTKEMANQERKNADDKIAQINAVIEKAIEIEAT